MTVDELRHELNKYAGDVEVVFLENITDPVPMGFNVIRAALKGRAVVALYAAAAPRVEFPAREM